MFVDNLAYPQFSAGMAHRCDAHGEGLAWLLAALWAKCAPGQFARARGGRVSPMEHRGRSSDSNVPSVLLGPG